MLIISLVIIRLALVLCALTSVTCNCPPLQPNKHVRVSCVAPDNQAFNCGNGKTSVDVGTTARYECEMYYKPTLERNFSPLLNCTSEGTWKGHVTFKEFQCVLNCGKRPSERTWLVSDGTPTNRTSWPWVAAIFRTRKAGTQDFIYICGGTLIGTSTILTAAHCLTQQGRKAILDTNLFRISLGSVSSQYFKNIDEGAVILKVSSVLLHELYNPETYEADVAIIFLEKNVELSESILPACLPRNYNNDAIALSAGREGEVASFGSDGIGSDIRNLKHTKAKVLSPDHCHVGIGIIPSLSQYCAGNKEGSTFCRGDSGSGMYFTSTSSTESKYTVHGVVSSSGPVTNDCSTSTIFTRVHLYIHWVEKEIFDSETHCSDYEQQVTSTNITRSATIRPRTTARGSSMTTSKLPSTRFQSLGMYDGNDAIVADTDEVISRKLQASLGGAVRDTVDQTSSYLGGKTSSLNTDELGKWEQVQLSNGGLNRVETLPIAPFWMPTIWNQGDYIYAFVGSSSNTVVRFSKSRKEAEVVSNMPVGLSKSSTNWDTDKRVAYIFGGYNNEDWNLNSILMFNEASVNVVKLASILPNAIRETSSVPIGSTNVMIMKLEFTFDLLLLYKFLAR